MNSTASNLDCRNLGQGCRLPARGLNRARAATNSLPRIRALLRREMVRLWLTISILAGFASATRAADTSVIYSDELDNGWQNWSWATVNLTNTSPVYAGADSIAVTAGAYQALWFHDSSIPAGEYANVSFWINGGSAGGQLLLVQATHGAGNTAVGSGVSLDPLPANSWRQVVVSLASLGVANDPTLNGFWIQDRSGAAQPVFYVDSVQLQLTNAPATNAPPATSTNVVESAVYSDELDNGWQNWSWATVNLANTSPVYAGADSIAVTAAAYQALWFYNSSIPAGAYDSVSFWINGGTAGGQLLLVQATHGAGNTAVGSGVSLDPLPANSWRQVVVPLASLGVANDPTLNGFWIQDRSGAAQPVFYVDSVQLQLTNAPATNAPPATSTNVVQSAVYSDELDNGWQNWSWATVNLANTSSVYAGADSIAVTAGAYQALWFYNSSIPAGAYDSLSFWINGGSAGGQLLLVQATHGAGNTAVGSGVSLDPLPANSWRQVVVPLASLGVANDPTLNGFWIQDRSGAAQPVFYVDSVALQSINGATNGAGSNSPAIEVSLDAGRTGGLISDLIYGVAFADSSNSIAQMNATLNRKGGNLESTYNWEVNAHNHDSDWFFESIADDSGAAAGADADSFIALTKGGGAQTLLTIPTLGWVAKLGPGRSILPSFSIAKYGAQTASDPYLPDAGNGVVSAGSPIKYVTGNDPNDANVPADPAFELPWLQHLTNSWGHAASGGVRYYILDNEPSIWFATHRDVHPAGPSMEEIRDKAVEYATMIKANDPGALVVGPEEWGWTGYFYSGLDQQYGGIHGFGGSLPDRGTNGNMDYLPWFLDQMRQKSAAAGQRLLDVFTVHYYPEQGEYSTDDISTATQLLRNRSTRSLWDTTYVDTSWINDTVKLIPRLKGWVAQYYPGTLAGITEYSWGADNYINGATAQADVLGIMGREGLDIATRWTSPAPSSVTFKAFQMYRNYDGHNSTFGQTTIPVAVPNPDNVAVFAARRTTDGALTVMAVNKQLSAGAPLALSITNFAVSASVQVWQLTSANQIQRLPDATLSQSVLSNTLPAQSITLFVVPPSARPTPSLSIQSAANSQIVLKLSSGGGLPFVIQSTADFKVWTNVATNAAGTDPATFTLPQTNPMKFFRATLP